MLTFWQYRQPQPPPSDLAELGGVVRGFHSALAELAADLPPLADKIDMRQRSSRIGSNPGLTNQAGGSPREPSRASTSCSIRSNRIPRFTGRPMREHDLDGGRAALIDFEASCTGPLEWDLAYLPDEARNAFPDRDEALIERSAPPSATASPLGAGPT